MSESHEADADKMPADEELKEPSTEKEPGDEPKDGDDARDAVDHEAVGIGIVEHEPVDDRSSEGEVSRARPSAAGTATPDSAPPTEAASDEVRSAAADVEEA